LLDYLINIENIIFMKLRYLAFLSLIAVSMMSCQTTEPSGSKFLTSYDGFEKTGLSGAQVYHGNVKKLASYRRVYIEPVRIIAAPDQEKKNKATPEEIATLKSKFETELRAELATTHTVVSRPGRRTLTVRAALVEIQPGTPALFLAGYAPYAGTVSTAIGVATGTRPGSGATSVQAEVIDSRTREQFFAVIERKQAAKWQPLQGLTRWGQAEASFRKWSDQIRKELCKVDAPVEVAATEKAAVASGRGPAKS